MHQMFPTTLWPHPTQPQYTALDLILHLNIWMLCDLMLVDVLLLASISFRVAGDGSYSYWGIPIRRVLVRCSRCRTSIVIASILSINKHPICFNSVGGHCFSGDDVSWWWCRLSQCGEDEFVGGWVSWGDRLVGRWMEWWLVWQVNGTDGWKVGGWITILIDGRTIV